MQNHDLDLYLNTLRDIEKKGAQNEPQRQQHSRWEGPRDSRAHLQHTSCRTGRETGPWYDDRRSERSDGSHRSHSGDRSRHDVPHWQTRRREIPTPQPGVAGRSRTPSPDTHTHNAHPCQEWLGASGAHTQPNTPARSGGAQPKPEPKHTHPHRAPVAKSGWLQAEHTHSPTPQPRVAGRS